MSLEVGSKVEGKVTGITHFGAFVELPGGETGLVHISEIADNYVKDVNDFLKIDDVVTVKIINKEENGKIGLSIRKAQERPKKQKNDSFENKLSKFLRDSEDRLSTLRRNADGKRSRSKTR